MNAKTFYWKSKPINVLNNSFSPVFISGFWFGWKACILILWKGEACAVDTAWWGDGGVFCWQPWEPLLLLFSLSSPPTPHSPFWLFCWGSTSPRELWGMGWRKEKVERGESRSQLPAVREGCEEGQCSVPSSVISGPDPDPYSRSVSSPNQARYPATEPGCLLPGTSAVSVQPDKSVWRGGLARVFYPQGSDYKVLRMNGSWCHCWLRGTQNATLCAGPKQSVDFQPQVFFLRNGPESQAECILAEEMNLAFAFMCVEGHQFVSKHGDLNCLSSPRWSYGPCSSRFWFSKLIFTCVQVAAINPVWCLICRVGGVHTLRGGSPEIWGLCSFRGFW